ncbi:hypothetical protein AMECASPLE_013410 [Ameca splendens]|uniref:Uncharacterized protein n=1 Tax=Ameca splendens TaxID=208324 RepID=A0ABV0XEI1_9TELE
MSVPRRLGGVRSGGPLLGSGFLHHRSLPDPGFPGLPNRVFLAARRRPLRGIWSHLLPAANTFPTLGATSRRVLRYDFCLTCPRPPLWYWLLPGIGLNLASGASFLTVILSLAVFPDSP